MLWHYSSLVLPIFMRFPSTMIFMAICNQCNHNDCTVITQYTNSFGTYNYFQSTSKDSLCKRQFLAGVPFSEVSYLVAC